MQSYVKKVKIVPELDLTQFQNEWNNLIKGIGKISDDLRKPFDDLQEDFSISVTKDVEVNRVENVDEIRTITEKKDKTSDKVKVQTKGRTFDKVKDRAESKDKTSDKVKTEVKSKDVFGKDLEKEIKYIFKKIDKGIDEEFYLDKSISINDFFRNLQKELSLTPEYRERIEKREEREEKIQDLSSYMDYLQDNANTIQEYIKTLSDKLSQTEGYDLYQAKEQLKKNKSEISNLELYEDENDVDVKKRIDELKKSNDELKKTISSLNKKEYDFNEIESTLASIEKLTDKYNELMEDYTDAELDKTLLEEKEPDFEDEETDWGDIGEKIGKHLSDKLVSALNKFADSFKELLDNALEEFDKMSQYNMETSLRVNSEVRDQALQYGLDSAQNYALSKTWEVMGISSEEDMNNLTPLQQERFADLIGKYTSQYQEIADKDLFSKYEEYQAAVQDFRDELQMEVIEFFAENKDTIISVMEFLMDALSAILDVVTWINETLRPDEEETPEENAAKVSDIINSYSISNSNKTTIVKIDNSFSNISPKEQSQYISAGKRVNEQLISALNEG